MMIDPILFIIIVILPPYMEIYKVLSPHLAINFEILRLGNLVFCNGLQVIKTLHRGVTY
jgi:hypothetical protein